MNDEQIANWRRVLAETLGPYALIMPVEQIEQFRNLMQARADKLAGQPEDPDVPGN